MNKIRIIIMAITILLLSGCLSILTYEDSKQKVQLKQTYNQNNQLAIKAIKLGDDGIGLGIDVLKWDIIKEQPFKLAGAALLDAGLIYAGYESIMYLVEDREDNSQNNQDSGRDSNQITIQGDGNTIHIGYEEKNIKEGE